MTSLFQFKEKIHRKNLSMAESIPLLFPQMLSYVLEHLGFPAESHRGRCHLCEATFTIEKWQFMPGAPPIPSFLPAREDQ